MAPVTRSNTSSPSTGSTPHLNLSRKQSSKSLLRATSAGLADGIGNNSVGETDTLLAKEPNQSSQSSPEKKAANSTNSSPSKRKYRQFKSLFKPRASPLDFETLWAEKHPFRGFFVLFWVSIAYKYELSSLSILFFCLISISMRAQNSCLVLSILAKDGEAC